MRPLRRKPKQLTEEPTLYRPSGSGGSLALTSAGSAREETKKAASGVQVPGETAETGNVIALGEQSRADPSDQTTLAWARLISNRLAVPPPRRGARSRRNMGELSTLQWDGTADDLDLERTMEHIAGRPFPAPPDIFVRGRVRSKRSIALVVDVSGSMKGERLRTAAAAIAALAGEFSRDDLAVVAFWSDAAVLVQLHDKVDPTTVLDLLLRVPAQGLTNITFALETAARQLDGVPAQDARVLLLSDCVHNAGPDPRLVAARLPRLDVMLDSSSEQDVDLAQDLARYGRGRLRIVRGPRDVAPALSAIFQE